MGPISLIGWAVFGLIAGGVARLLMPGPDRLGCLGTMALGVLGSLAGGYLGALLFGADDNQWHPAGFIGAVIGSMLLLGILRLLRPGPRGPGPGIRP